MHADVRLRQLDCMLYVLHLSGDTLCYGWPLVLNTIAAVSDFLHGYGLNCYWIVILDIRVGTELQAKIMNMVRERK